MSLASQSRWFTFKNTASCLAEILALVIAYHPTARVGLKVAYVQANTSPVWLPNTVASIVMSSCWLMK